MSRTTRELFPGTLCGVGSERHTGHVNPVLALTVGVVAVVMGGLVWRAGQRRIGGLLVAHGVSFATLLAATSESSGAFGLIVDQLSAGSWVLLFLWLAVIAYLVPDGHTASLFWHRWLLGGLSGAVLFLVGAAGDAEGFRAAHAGTSPPLPWLPAPMSALAGVLGLVVTFALLAGSPAAVWWRLRRTSGDERLRVLWLVWGATSLPIALGLAWLGHFWLGDDVYVVNAGLLLAGLGLPVTIGMAILRHRLFDIEVVLSRTLIYGVLVVGVVATYALLLGTAERLGGDGTAGGLVAVGIVAVAVNPAYTLLRGRIERWVYGYRHDPVAAMRQLSVALETADPLGILDTLTDSVADALKARRVTVDLAPADPPSPGPSAAITRVPLVHRGLALGDLVVQVPPGRRLSAADRALLEDLSSQAAGTVRAVQLAAELQAARARTVIAREEERKRLRRDLHDDLGPLLAAVALKVQAAQHRSAEEERTVILDEALVDTRAAITEIRRVVDDLRPPALDEVGLLAALRQRAASLSTPALTFRVIGPDPMPDLPAAVEVAVFRIAVEAMTNAARHSGASCCNVTVGLDDRVSADTRVRVDVVDDGQGGAATTTAGIGLASMAERAAELGGDCVVTEAQGGGIHVRVLLPVRDHARMEVLG